MFPISSCDVSAAQKTCIDLEGCAEGSAYLGHSGLALEAPTDAVVDTLGLAP
jgi:hypothetical protein